MVILIVAKTFTIRERKSINNILNCVADMVSRGLAAGPVVITLAREIRTRDQNAKLWPLLDDISRQVVWYGSRYSKEDWKDILTAGWRKQEVVPGIDGGFVVLGHRTSKMNKAQMSELIEFIYAFGSGHEVKWSEKAREIWEQVS